MNKLSVEKRSKILSMLCDGMTMRSISRAAGVSINTVSKLLLDAGTFCSQFHDDWVRGVEPRYLQVDEIWSFAYPKQSNTKTSTADPDEPGDAWTWTAIDRDSKLIISWLAGGRGSEYAHALMGDLRDRLAKRTQLTTPGHGAYEEIIEVSFAADVDHAQLLEIYNDPSHIKSLRRYSRADFVSAMKQPFSGSPDMRQDRANAVDPLRLSLSMGTPRFSRLTKAFSSKFVNHVHMVAIYTVFHNWIRPHKDPPVTPAMKSGLSDHGYEWADILKAMDAATLR